MHYLRRPDFVRQLKIPCTELLYPSGVFTSQRPLFWSWEANLKWKMEKDAKETKSWLNSILTHSSSYLQNNR